MTRGLRNNNPLNIRKVPGTHWRGEVLPPKGATGVFRGATECGSGPTKGSDYPVATEDREGAGDREFVQFSSVEYGIRAAFCILNTYRRKYKAVCIEDIINRWAPPSENATSEYIRTVCRLTGFGGKERLEESQLPALVCAMAFVECGAHISKETILKGYNLFKEIQNSKLKNQKL